MPQTCSSGPYSGVGAADCSTCLRIRGDRKEHAEGAAAPIKRREHSYFGTEVWSGRVTGYKRIGVSHPD